MKHIFILLVFILGLVNNSNAQQVQNLNVKEFKKLLDSTPNNILIDVRTNAEIKEGILPNAIQIDYNGQDFETKIEKLDKSRPVFVYCAVGGRSGKTSTILLKKGFKQVYNLSGGINAWKAEGMQTKAFIK